MSTSPRTSSLPPAGAIAAGAGLALFLSSFLPWYHASVTVGTFSASASHNGWHSAAFLVWILALATGAFSLARFAGVVSLPAAQADRIQLGLVAVTVVLGALHVIIRLVNGQIGWGVFVGLVLVAILAFAGYLFAQTGGGRAVVADARARADQARRP